MHQVKVRDVDEGACHITNDVGETSAVARKWITINQLDVLSASKYYIQKIKRQAQVKQKRKIGRDGENIVKINKLITGYNIFTVYFSCRIKTLATSYKYDLRAQGFQNTQYNKDYSEAERRWHYHIHDDQPSKDSTCRSSVPQSRCSTSQHRSRTVDQSSFLVSWYTFSPLILFFYFFCQLQYNLTHMDLDTLFRFT